MTKNILITGGAGFIGSNFIPYFAARHPEYMIVNVDALTYAGNLSNLSEMQGAKNYKFKESNIRDMEGIPDIFEEYEITDVINFAAESHVDNSISGPRKTIFTNINGTLNLLECAREHWGTNAANRRFHHISTDEVYGSLGDTGLFTETTPYDPSSPYSASKAASDHLVQAWHRTYGMNTTISNCSNNYGPKQHSEKLIPTIIRKAIAGEDIPIYGNGKNVRDWLYVLDHCKAIDLIFHKGMAGETYNVGGRNERNNIEIATKICEILDAKMPKHGGSYADQIAFVKDRPGHDFRYAIDATKLETELGWRADENFDSGILKTINWYLNQNTK